MVRDRFRRRTVLGALGTALIGGTVYTAASVAGQGSEGTDGSAVVDSTATPERRVSGDVAGHDSADTTATATETPDRDPVDYEPEMVLTPTELPSLRLADTRAEDVNDSGVVVGRYVAVLPKSEAIRAIWWPDEETAAEIGSFVDKDDERRGSSRAFGLNDCETVVGSAATSPDPREPVSHAFRWTEDDGLCDLGTLGGPESLASDISDDGIAVGWADTGEGERHAVRWLEDEDEPCDLGTLREDDAGNSIATAVTDDGRVVGGSETDAGRIRAFEWTPDEGMRDLGALSPTEASFATDATAGCSAVGSSFDPGDRALGANEFPGPSRRAARFVGGEQTDLGGLDLGSGESGYSEARAVDEDGVAVGFSEFANEGTSSFSQFFLAVRFIEGEVEPLGILSDRTEGYGTATSLNTHGTIAGWDRHVGAIRPVVWRED
jgi:probable HAF family extracellular repeat protein